MRLSITIITMFLINCIQSQDLFIKGTVKEAVSGIPLMGVNVSVQGSNQGAFSGQDGSFTLIITSSEQQKTLELYVQHLGFESRVVQVLPAEMKVKGQERVLEVAIVLQSQIYPLDTAIISSLRLPELVYASEQHSIADYAFMDHGMILLAYEKRLEKASKIYWVNEMMQPLDSLIIPSAFKALGLREDYASELYLEVEGGLFWIHLGQGKLSMDPVDLKIFRESIAPVIDTLEQRVYFSTWIEQFPAFEYMIWDKQDSIYAGIKQVADAFMLELCRADYKYLNTRDKLRLYRLELETGIEKEVLACFATFKEGLYYDPIYAPMFLWEETLYLFDHASDAFFTFDQRGAALDSVPILYHDPKKVMANPFMHELIMDESNGNIYAICQKSGGK